MAAAPCMLGFTPHSGWAALVIVGGSVDAPRVLARDRIELADAQLQGSRQPYHALEGLPIAEARRRLAQLEASAAAMALLRLRTVLARLEASGHEARGASLLESAGRSGASLEAILASHALIHTADGNHFRAALAHACQELGLPMARVGQRELTGRTAAVLRRPASSVAETITTLGRGLGPPWGADQKSAALLAWLELAETQAR